MLFWARSVCLHPCLVSAPSTCRSSHPPCVLPTPPCQILSAIKYHFLASVFSEHGVEGPRKKTKKQIQAMRWPWYWRQMTEVTEWLTKLLNWVICPPPNFGPTKNHTYTPAHPLPMHYLSTLPLPVKCPYCIAKSPAHVSICLNFARPK